MRSFRHFRLCYDLEMKWSALFVERVFFPFWPLPVALFFGVVTCPRIHVYWWELAVKLSYLLGLLISLRYLWAMKHGAPIIAWMLWLGMAFGIWIVAMFIVSKVASVVV